MIDDLWIEITFLNFEMKQKGCIFTRKFKVRSNDGHVDTSALTTDYLACKFDDIIKLCNRKRLYKDAGYVGYTLANYICGLFDCDCVIVPRIKNLNITINTNITADMKTFYYNAIRDGFIAYLADENNNIENASYLLKDLAEFEKRRV